LVVGDANTSAELCSAGQVRTPAPTCTVVNIGVISDTHGLLRPEALGALRGCNYIVHAGDIGDPAILKALALLPQSQRFAAMWIGQLGQ
jgi:hypothetical protein